MFIKNSLLLCTDKQENLLKIYVVFILNSDYWNLIAFMQSIVSKTGKYIIGSKNRHVYHLPLEQYFEIKRNCSLCGYLCICVWSIWIYIYL